MKLVVEIWIVRIN